VTRPAAVSPPDGSLTPFCRAIAARDTAAAQRVRTARCNAVTWLLSVAFGSAPAWSRTLTASAWAVVSRAAIAR